MSLLDADKFLVLFTKEIEEIDPDNFDEALALILYKRIYPLLILGDGMCMLLRETEPRSECARQWAEYFERQKLDESI